MYFCFCLNSTMLVYYRVLCTLSITWPFTGVTSFDLNVHSLFRYLNNRKETNKKKT